MRRRDFLHGVAGGGIALGVSWMPESALANPLEFKLSAQQYELGKPVVIGVGPRTGSFNVCSELARRCLRPQTDGRSISLGDASAGVFPFSVAEGKGPPQPGLLTLLPGSGSALYATVLHAPASKPKRAETPKAAVAALWDAFEHHRPTFVRLVTKELELMVVENAIALSVTTAFCIAAPLSGGSTLSACASGSLEAVHVAAEHILRALCQFVEGLPDGALSAAHRKHWLGIFGLGAELAALPVLPLHDFKKKSAQAVLKVGSWAADKVVESLPLSPETHVAGSIVLGTGHDLASLIITAAKR